MTQPMISYQMYSSRNFPDVARQAKMLAGIGLRHVEPFGGQFGDVGALAEILAENRLTAPTAHIGAPTWRSDFDGILAKLARLGVKTAFMPAVPPDERTQSLDAWKALGRELSGYAARMKDHGIQFGWHNHAFEMVTLEDGSMPIEWILGEDIDVKWQMDIAWTVRGQQDPTALIRRYRDRIVSFHVKDLAAEGENVTEDGWADVGHGVLDWASLVPVMRETPATVWVLEHDNPSDDARFATRAFATVTSW